MKLPKRSLDENIAIHIFSVSAGMVGVCLTVIGLIQIVIQSKKEDTVIDDLLVLDAILFLLSCIFSYWALRKRSIKRLHNTEEIADSIFVIALILMVVICGIIACTLGRFI
jgi:hypothetical protein